MAGPTPTFCPVFPEDFLREARGAVRRKTAPYQSGQRYQLALLLHQEPYVPHEEAGQRVGVSGGSGPTLAQAVGRGGLFRGGRLRTGAQARFFPLWSRRWARQ
jgi:hypothetical protein